MASALAYMSIITEYSRGTECTKEFKETLLQRSCTRAHADKRAKLMLAEEMLVTVARAAGAL